MSNAAPTSSANLPPEAASTEPRPASFLEPFMPVLRPLASLQMTVVLFVLSLFLVFFGTMAQMNEGIWTVVDKYFRSGVVWIPFELIAKFSNVFFTPYNQVHFKGSFPFPGGWLLGSVMLVNLLSAHLIRFRMTWKRSGIFIIHAGVITLMLGELITGLYAVESTMTLTVGESSDFVDETLSVELAIARPAGDGVDEVVKVPGSRLKKPGVISHPDLPVDVEVLGYWKNSDLKMTQGPPPDEWWIDGGEGVSYLVVERPEEAGVESDQRGDAPAVRINLRKKGTDESVGKFLLSLWYYPNSTMNSRRFILPPLTFEADGREYTIMLRNKRAYKPYTVRLKKFEHDKYQGTDIAKDYASTVDVIDHDDGSTREARIWMNNPLRYRESSLYQLSVLRGDGGTVLQVVRNPGRLLPYLACSMVSGGLLIHFGIHLNAFLRRGRRRREGAADAKVGADLAGDPPSWARYLPIAVGVLAAAWVASKAMVPPAKPDQIDYYDVGKIPVLHGGRVKPLDTVARTTLQAISGRTEVQDEKKKVVASAAQWYIDVFDSRNPFEGKAAEYKIFRIDNDQVLSLLELKPRPEFFRYSLKEIAPRYLAFQSELKKVQEKQQRDEKKKLDLRDTRILDLGKKLHHYQRLALGETPHLVPPQAEGEEWRTMETIDAAVEFTPPDRAGALGEAYEGSSKLIRRAMQKLDRGDPEQAEEFQDLSLVLSALDEYTRLSQRRAEIWTEIRKLREQLEAGRKEGKEADDAATRRLAELEREETEVLKDLDGLERNRIKRVRETVGILSMMARQQLTARISDMRDRVSPAAGAFTKLMRLGKEGDVGAFNEALASYRQEYLGRVSGDEVDNVRYEAFFNHFSPFYWCSYLYVMVIILAVLGWLVWREPLNNSALWLGVLTLLLHTFALLMRMYLQGRPPVTNLYSSAVFIGWGCVLVCLGMEAYFRNGICNIVGGGLGALTMMIAHFLSESGDTMEMLVAVLDTNFWLATHVTIVTLGYMATFVAGFIAVLYVVLGIFTTEVKGETRKTFGQMLYGTIAFATLLSFTGTVLGGIWADYSWGRFWGWDAKENGAVMVVIWNTLILHARWAGLVKLRGVAVLALGGIMITFWSWFGTNQLQAGLHSYGFSTELAERCKWVWIGSLALIALALLPTKYWRSYAAELAPAATRDVARPPAGGKRPRS